MKNNNVPTPKFSVGEKVYAFAQNGMNLFTIEAIVINITKEHNLITYYFIEGVYTGYREENLTASIEVAKKKLIMNTNQLQLPIS